MKIDVLIPCAEKDIETLEICIKGCKKHIKEDVENIYVVSKKNSSIIDVCNRQGCIFVDEDSVFDFTIDDLKKVRKWNRWGWIYQQFIKLCGTITKNEDFVVVDSEVFFVKDIHFIKDNNPIFYCHSRYLHKPYFDMIKRITGQNVSSQVSFICDFMIFNKKKLNAIKQKIEDYTKKKWTDAIIDNIREEDGGSPFSEYETYGNFYDGEYTLSVLRHAAIGEICKDESKYTEFDVVVMHAYLRDDS